MDNHTLIDDLIELAIKEDLGNGDHTSLSCLPQNKISKAQLLVKDHGILAGTAIAQRVFNKIDKRLQTAVHLEDGCGVKPGDVAFTVEGPQVSILSAERIVLNFMQRMSGIATETHRYASVIADLKTKILDTRKTTPGLRLIEKLAVKIGGGHNHRIGLYDMILIKDNHIDYAGGIDKAVKNVLSYLSQKKLTLPIEVEARNLSDVEKILECPEVFRILLDNFAIEDTKRAVERIQGRIQTESSGGMTMANLRAYAECGVDFISIGALTHQIKSLDLSLKAV